jgi:hypothetical protein
MKQQQHQYGLVRLTRRITRLENKVHQVMTVMDKDTGKLLRYKQLMNSPKYKKAWSLTAANKFGRLANGIGGRIIKTTNTIKFISQYKVMAYRRKKRHIRAVCMLGQTQKDRTQPNAIHGRRQQNQLPRQNSHPNHRNASGQNAIQ